jgi:hypothetical protein
MTAGLKISETTRARAVARRGWEHGSVAAPEYTRESDIADLDRGVAAGLER